MGASSWAPCPRVGPWHTAEALLLLGVADAAGTRGASDRGCCEGASEKWEPGPNGRSKQLGYGLCKALLCVHCFFLTSEQRGTLPGTQAPLLRFVLSVAAVAQAERWSRRAVEMRGERGQLVASSSSSSNAARGGELQEGEHDQQGAVRHPDPRAPRGSKPGGPSWPPQVPAR